MFNPAFEKGPSFDRARSQIATPFQYIDIALDVAASNQIVNIAGDFLYVDAISNGVVTLELNNQYSDPSAPFLANPGFGLAALFKQLKLSWAAQPGKFVRLMYSTGDRVVPTNSTTVNGVVNTVDGGLTRTLADQAFLGYSNAGAVAAQYPHNALWNPPGSGKNLYLETFVVSSGTAQLVQTGSYNVLMAAYGVGANKYLSHAAGVGLTRFTNNVAALIVAAGAVYRVLANSPLQVQLKEPVVVPPGWGFVSTGLTVNTDLSTSYEWYEQ